MERARKGKALTRARDCVHHAARQRSDEHREYERRRRGLLEKPVDGEAVLTAVRRAAERIHALEALREEVIAIERRYGRMTSRERQVFTLVTAGSLNKQITFDLGVAERTEAHRARAMEKMETDSLAQLARMAQLLAVHRSRNVSELRA